MTERKILNALGKIKEAKQKGFPMEALLLNYHLNVQLLKFIVQNTSPNFSLEDKKAKALVNELLKESDSSLELKKIINKKSLKTIKVWLAKMDVFFKTLKLQQPKNSASLQNESETVCVILKMSVTKIFASSKA